MKTDKNILIAFLLNLSFSIFEFIGGIFTGSVAILSDSFHDICDALSIGISYFHEKKSKKEANYKYTYGYIRYSILGGIITTIILITGSIFVIVASVKRLFNPVNINYDGMIIFAIIGVTVNMLASYSTKGGHSLNQKSVNLHMIEDVLGWIVVLIGSILMKFTDITYIDSILSILVALFILFNALKNIKRIIEIFLEKTPKDINIEKLKKHILRIDGVYDIHHIHIRSIDGFNNFLTMHAVVDKYNHEIKGRIKEELKKHNISHSTIELELKDEICNDIKCEIKSEHNSHHH